MLQLTQGDEESLSIYTQMVGAGKLCELKVAGYPALLFLFGYVLDVCGSGVAIMFLPLEFVDRGVKMVRSTYKHFANAALLVINVLADSSKALDLRNIITSMDSR